MDGNKMQRASKEALRFLDAVRQMQAASIRDANAWYGSRESGALRRASLDLTRALADLRRRD